VNSRGSSETELEAIVTTPGFKSFEITRREDVFGGAPQEGSAASFGPLGINFKAHKPADDQGRLQTTTTSDRAASPQPVEGQAAEKPVGAS
jgi:hypothetical protein